MPAPLPIPPENLRIWVGPFADAEVFRDSGVRNVRSIVELCALQPDARVLEVGCGCGRIAAALAPHLSAAGSYEGFDVAAPLVDWCRMELATRLPNFRFHFAGDVRAPGYNPSGTIWPAHFEFPYPAASFDLVILSSVLTHMLPDAIDNYIRQTARVLRPGGSAFMSVFLFDAAAATAVRNGTTIFDFRHAVGPCLTFDREHPEEGIACEEAWFASVIANAGLRIAEVQRGDWRAVRSYAITQDYVVAKRPMSAV